MKSMYELEGQIYPESFLNNSEAKTLIRLWKNFDQNFRLRCAYFLRCRQGFFFQFFPFSNCNSQKTKKVSIKICFRKCVFHVKIYHISFKILKVVEDGQKNFKNIHASHKKHQIVGWKKLLSLRAWNCKGESKMKLHCVIFRQ